jgi:membrane-associated protease RseP (regulator of RpoE activity)
MRWWSIRARRLPPPPPLDEMLVTEDRLRRNVKDVLVVRDQQVRGAAVVFRGELMVEPARALDLLIDRFRPLGYMPFLRAEEAGVVAVQAWPFAEPVAQPRIQVNVLLFLATCVSTLVAGFGLPFIGLGFVGSPTFDALRASSSVFRFLAGTPFAFTLMAILVVHELGHYFTARHYHAAVSLPYFIPFPLGFGTLGAIILMRSSARNRNSLFDIAAAGPLAGLAVAIPAIILGLAWSTVVPEPPGGHFAFGDSLLTRAVTYLRFGSIPPGYMVFTHPIADAAWAGLFVTALNLFPIGQLDGGRIAYALFGARHRAIGKATVLALVGLGAISFGRGLHLSGGDVLFAVLFSLNWFLVAALVSLLVGLHHSPPLDDVSPISAGRRVVGVVCLALLVLMVPPFIH